MDVQAIVAAPDKAAILRPVVDQYVLSMGYKRPSEWFRQLNGIVSLNCPTDAEAARFSEFKATRDVFVHNRGIVTEIYLDKAATLARAALRPTVGLAGLVCARRLAPVPEDRGRRGQRRSCQGMSKTTRFPAQPLSTEARTARHHLPQAGAGGSDDDRTFCRCPRSVEGRRGSRSRTAGERVRRHGNVCVNYALRCGRRIEPLRPYARVVSVRYTHPNKVKVAPRAVGGASNRRGRCRRAKYRPRCRPAAATCPSAALTP